tara:strand:+ start:839 stop:946 length:108 start_codon:yes stop_codon:yes gene_type:complete
VSELVAVTGYYVMTAMMMNAFAVSLSVGDPHPFPE